MLKKKTITVHVFAYGDCLDVNTWSGVPYYISMGLVENGASLIYSNFSFPRLSAIYNCVVSQLNRVIALISSRIRLKSFFISIIGHAITDIYIFISTLIHYKSDINLFFSYTYGWSAVPACNTVLLHDQTHQQSIDRGKLHGRHISVERGRLIRQHWTLRKAALIFATTRPTIDHLESSYDGKLFIHPEIVSYIALHPLPESAICSFGRENSYKLLFIGREPYYRGLDILIKALSLLHSSTKYDIKLTVVGININKTDFNTNHDYIQFYKYLDKSIPEDFEIYCRLLSEATLLVMPQRGSLLAGVMLEALYYSTPVVTTDVPGINDFIENDFNGLLIQEPDPVMFANAISELLSDSTKLSAMSANAAQSVKSLTPQNAAKELIDASLNAISRGM